MSDDHELDGLDPFDLLDREADRIARHFADLPPDEWPRPSRCAGWSVGDVLRHLLAGEEYHQACLDGRVGDYLDGLSSAGAVDLDQANALGVTRLADRSPGELLAAWRATNADTRRRFRARGDGLVDTSVGDYPNRWQAFHVAAELATHADDAYVPVTGDEAAARRAWRVRFSRFSLAESKPDLVVIGEDGCTRVQGPGVDLVVDDELFVEAVASRVRSSPVLDDEALALLGTVA